VLTIIPWKIAETLIIAHITQLGRKIKVFAGRKKRTTFVFMATDRKT